MPMTRALDTTPKKLMFTLLAYAMVLFIVIMIRWRLKHGYQEEQLRREQSYQQQLKDAARKAESANSAKTEFLQRMSHAATITARTWPNRLSAAARSGMLRLCCWSW